MSNSRIKMKALLALFLIMPVASITAAELEIGESYYPPVTNDFEVLAEEFQLSDADREELLIGAYALLPEQQFGRAVEEMRLHNQTRVRQHVEVRFESETVSPNRTERFTAHCGRQITDSEWRCHAVSQSAQQLLPGESEAIRIRGPITELEAMDAATVIQAFVADSLEQPPEPFEIQSMIRPGPTQLAGPEEPSSAIQVKVRVSDYEIRMDLYPIAENSRQLAVIYIVCYSNFETNDPTCDATDSIELEKLIQAAQINQQKTLLSEMEIHNLLRILRPMVSDPDLLAHYQPPFVQTTGGWVFVDFKFEPLVHSTHLSVQTTAGCNRPVDEKTWDCKVGESVKLKIPRQEEPVGVYGDFTEQEVLRLVEYVRKMATNHPELGVDGDVIRITGITSDIEQDDDGFSIDGSVTVHAYAPELGMVNVAFERDAFEIGELVVGEIRVHRF